MSNIRLPYVTPFPRFHHAPTVSSCGVGDMLVISASRLYDKMQKKESASTTEMTIKNKIVELETMISWAGQPKITTGTMILYNSNVARNVLYYEHSFYRGIYVTIVRDDRRMSGDSMERVIIEADSTTLEVRTAM